MSIVLEYPGADLVLSAETAGGVAYLLCRLPPAYEAELVAKIAAAVVTLLNEKATPRS